MSTDFKVERLRIVSGSSTYTLTSSPTSVPTHTEPAGSLARASDGTLWRSTGGGSWVTVGTGSGGGGGGSGSGDFSAAYASLQTGITSSIDDAFTSLQVGSTSSVGALYTSVTAGATASNSTYYAAILTGVTASDAAVQSSLRSGVTSSIDSVYSSLRTGSTASIGSIYTTILVGTSASDSNIQASLKTGVTSSIGSLYSSVTTGASASDGGYYTTVLAGVTASIAAVQTSLAAGSTASIGSIYTTVLVGTSASDSAVQISLKTGITSSISSAYSSLQAGITSSVGAGGIGGLGTVNRIPRFTAGTTIGDSSIVDDGVRTTFRDVTVTGSLSASFDSRFGRDVVVIRNITASGRLDVGSNSGMTHVLRGTAVISTDGSAGGNLRADGAITGSQIRTETDFYVQGNPLSGTINARFERGSLLNVQKFTSDGTYTPTPGTRAIVVEMVGGGGGTGAAIAISGTFSATGGGASGVYWRKFIVLTSATGSLIIGAGGASGTRPSGFPMNGAARVAANGKDGGTTILFINSTSYVAPGGSGSNVYLGTTSVFQNVPGGGDRVGSAGADVSLAQPGGYGMTWTFIGHPSSAASTTCYAGPSGEGGSTPLGQGGSRSSLVGYDLTVAGEPGSGYGAGASGAAVNYSLYGALSVAGSSGSQGVAIIYEYA